MTEAEFGEAAVGVIYTAGVVDMRKLFLDAVKGGERNVATMPSSLRAALKKFISDRGGRLANRSDLKFFRALNAAGLQPALRQGRETCKTCNGTGNVTQYNGRLCWNCQGRGDVNTWLLP